MNKEIKNAWDRIKDTIDRADGDANITEIGDIEVVETVLNQAEENEKELIDLRKFVKEIRQYYFVGLDGFEFIVNNDREAFRFVADMIDKYR